MIYRPSSPELIEEPVIFLVDDDPSLRESLQSLFRSVGYKVKMFGSSAELLESHFPDVPSCLVLDVRLPGISGLDLQTELARARVNIPIIFITGHGDIPMSVKAMKAGAIDFLAKPFRDQDMLDAVAIALDQDRERRQAEKQLLNLRACFDTLTQREREVMRLVVDGLLNKQVAGELKLSEITVKVHRGNVMRKMGAHSLADLVRMAEILGVRATSP